MWALLVGDEVSVAAAMFALMLMWQHHYAVLSIVCLSKGKGLPSVTQTTHQQLNFRHLRFSRVTVTMGPLWHGCGDSRVGRQRWVDSLSESTESLKLLLVIAGAGAAAAANDAAGYFRFELLRRLILEFVMPWVSLLLATRRKAAGKRPEAQPAATIRTVTATATARDPSTGHVSTAVVTASDNDLRTSSTVGSAVRAGFRNADSSQVAGQVPRQAAPAAAGRLSPEVSGAGYVADSDVLRPRFDSFTGIWDVTRDMGYVTDRRRMQIDLLQACCGAQCFGGGTVPGVPVMPCCCSRCLDAHFSC